MLIFGQSQRIPICNQSQQEIDMKLQINILRWATPLLLLLLLLLLQSKTARSIKSGCGASQRILASASDIKRAPWDGFVCGSFKSQPEMETASSISSSNCSSRIPSRWRKEKKRKKRKRERRRRRRRKKRGEEMRREKRAGESLENLRES